MASPTQRQATCAVLVAMLLLCAPAHAAMVVGADGKPIRRGPGPALVIGEVRAGVPEPLVTALVRVSDLPPEEQEWLQARLFKRAPGEVCDCIVFGHSDAVVITDLRSNIERLLGRPIGR